MSIKTIDNVAVSNTDGLAKKINKGAEKLVFDILQDAQYSTPIPSTVRELTTNCCDAQREKEIAIEILTGKKSAQDYYITRDGEAYKDSNFNLDYYSLDHLDTENNHIDIKYIRNEGIGFCDKIIFKDYGVGIGDRRLEGVLELGYSTKRNTAENFGAFGLGAKVALSTGVDFYNITTVHNGRKFKLSCYPYTTKFNVPAFNPFITFSDGTKVHYEETTEKNYTEISFGVKKHNRQRFDDAIEEQLMYLSNVEYTKVYENGDKTNVDFKSDVIYNSDSLLVCDSYMYSRPHIVIVKELGATTGINYGYVDFRELEMEQLWGAVGLKCPIRQVVKDEYGQETVLQDGVDVTPSREKVIWNDHTKAFVQNLILKAAEEATELVEEQLQENDFLAWIQKCRDTLSLSSYNEGGTTALRQISKIIDTTSMRPKYPLNTEISFASPKGLFKGYKVEKVQTTVVKGKLSLNTETLNSWADVSFKDIYFREAGEPRNQMRDHFLLDSLENAKSFVLITTVSEPDAKQLANQILIDKYVQASQEYFDYANYNPTEEWITDFKTREKEITLANATSDLTPAEKRMIENRIVAYSLRHNGSFVGQSDRSSLTWDKVEPKLSTVMTSSRTTYYCTREEELKMKLAAEIMRDFAPKIKDVYENAPYYGWADGGQTSNDNPCFYYDCQSKIATTVYAYGDKITLKDDFETEMPQLLRVAGNKIKYVKKNPNCKHIDEFFLQVTDNNEYTMSKEVQTFINASLAGESPSWLERLDIIDPRFKDLYKYLEKHKDSARSAYIESAELKEVFTDFLNITSKLTEFQKYCNEVKNLENSEDLIASKSAELFILADIKGAQIFDPTVVEYAAIRDEISEDIDCFLSRIDFHIHSSSDANFTRELKFYLQSKGKLDIELPTITNPE